MASFISETEPGVMGRIRGLWYDMREGFPSNPNIIKPLYHMTRTADSDKFPSVRQSHVSGLHLKPTWAQQSLPLSILGLIVPCYN